MAGFAIWTSFAGHASLGAQAAHELSFAVDHPVGLTTFQAAVFLVPTITGELHRADRAHGFSNRSPLRGQDIGRRSFVTISSGQCFFCGMLSPSRG